MGDLVDLTADCGYCGQPLQEHCTGAEGEWHLWFCNARLAAQFGDILPEFGPESFVCFHCGEEVRQHFEYEPVLPGVMLPGGFERIACSVLLHLPSRFVGCTLDGSTP